MIRAAVFALILGAAPAFAQEIAQPAEVPCPLNVWPRLSR